MKNEKFVRQFVILSEAYYADVELFRRDGQIDEVLFGLFDPQGGAAGEMKITWTNLRGASVPKLESFDDSWAVLAQFGDVIQQLGKLDGTNPSPTKIAEILKSCGFIDATPRQNPYHQPEPDAPVP